MSPPGRVIVLLLFALGGCEGDGEGQADAATADDSRADTTGGADLLETDIRTTHLHLDVGAMTAIASITVTRPPSGVASFEIGDLAVGSVRDGFGNPLVYRAQDGRLDVTLAADEPPTVEVEYAFRDHTAFDGFDANRGLSFLWPTFCGNLFPCHSAPGDGVRFVTEVANAPVGTIAIHPGELLPIEAPSYMPAVAIDPFRDLLLAPTSAGTELRVYYHDGEETAAMSGSAHLTQVFDFYERTYGAYPFGPRAGSVSAAWPVGAYGGMEHHPFWHVSSGSFADESVHAHEAAHGWFGNGVRLRCWEDFVLSEGTVTYLAARALATVGVDVWSDYAAQLEAVCAPPTNTIAWPDGCDQIEILHDPLWSGVPYYKGAFFYRAVAERVGVDVLDDAIAALFQARVGRVAGMADMIEAIEVQSGMDIDDLVTSWLRSLACPPG